MAIQNIEIKARCEQQDNVRQFLKENKAVYKGTDHQIDTYFHVSQGRLKLRKGSVENNLIYYKRTDSAGPKNSRVLLYPAEGDSALGQLLADALGTLAVVDKKREIYFIDNVKFHIDSVETLGSFIEIEAIDRDGSIGIEKLRQQCDYYLNKLGISDDQLVPVSYSDMLLDKK
ncbi:class IV adenylate cyclase [Natronogracilivirga saccharolytica]|uniref:Class IV adenylate cyclase n=1 Tax=Natronogracilivirga saccharolytica TaxID=2812953 RepID=A0A8J7RJ32_9BACT|nr:class IV adenylate cyclase [Natronogracilivirga saccharolytica]MBP3191103.1 class IV adenylate cyclase [Natronogracilivirga saccharolytica]